MYFVVAVVVHIFVLVVGTRLGDVRSFIRVPWCIAMAKHDHYSLASPHCVHFCECIIDLEWRLKS